MGGIQQDGAGPRVLVRYPEGTIVGADERRCHSRRDRYGSQWTDVTSHATPNRNYFKNELTILFDTRDMNDTASDNLDILVVFLIIVAIIAITLAFFLLLLSNISNIRENVWEFGILRFVLIRQK